MKNNGNAEQSPHLGKTLECNDAPFVNISALPPFKRKRKQDIACQIAHHLVLLLENNQTRGLATVRVPSAMALSDFYQCTVLDVLDGLYAFKQKSNEYAMNGLDAEIILHNQPHILKTNPSKALWKGPWCTSHKIAENPLFNLFQGKAG